MTTSILANALPDSLSVPKSIVNLQSITQFNSGAKSSGSVLPFDLIPASLEEAAARRLGLGAAKYARHNWKKGLDDVAYVRERLNHMYQHFKNVLTGTETTEDDLTANIDAVVWGAMFLAEAAKNHLPTLRKAVGLEPEVLNAN